MFDGEDVRAFRGEALRRYNRRAQMVFQDPYGSLNPRMTRAKMLGEALRVHNLVPPEACGCLLYRRTAGPRRLPARAHRRACRTSSPAGSASDRDRPCPVGGSPTPDCRRDLCPRSTFGAGTDPEPVLDLQEQLALGDPVRLA